MMTTNESSYSAVILYYRAGSVVTETIGALLAQDVPPTELVLVDNASFDEFDLRSEFEHLPNLRILSLPSNLGYAGGMNRGYDALSREVDKVLFLTHEVQLEPGCIRDLIQCSDISNAGLVGPALWEATTNRQPRIWSLGGRIHRSGRVSHNCRAAIPPAPPEGISVDWLDGACILADHRLFSDISGFAEQYFLYWEDVDISQRAKDAGRDVRCCESAVARQSTQLAPPYFDTRNQILFWRGRRRCDLAFLAILRALARSTRCLLRRQPVLARAYIIGARDGIAGKLTESPLRLVRR